MVNQDFLMKNRKFSIAVDLGGTKIKLGVLKAGKLIDKTEVDSDSVSGLKMQLPQIEKRVNQLLQKNGLQNNDVLGIGCSFAGLVDSERNRIISTNKKYDDGPETDLVAWAKNTWNWPLFMENDARVALLGEWKYGEGRGFDNIVMVTLGTGVGSAVLLEGRLIKGKHFQAGNLCGHLTVNYIGKKCTCGNTGCVEAEASTWSLPSLVKNHASFNQSSLKDEPLLDFEVLFSKVEQNDSLAKDVAQHCITVWAAGIVSMIHAFDPELVILSGGIMKSAEVILPAIKQKINNNAWTPWGRIIVKKAQFPDSSALFGGDYLVRTKV